LADEAGREQGPEYPRNASQASYYLLAGLAARRPEIKDPTDYIRPTFGLDAYRTPRAALFEINPQTRVSLVET
jgi:hypothetical protein